jgi:short-subunit dehydrogenase
MKLAGARVVVTGAGSGIGAATARLLAERGAHVIGVDINAAAVAEVCEHHYACDVSDADAVDALAAQIESEHGPVDALVNNAGVGVYGPFLDGTLEDWRWLRGVNLDGVIHGCRAFAPAMLERGRGQIVNVASGAAYTPSRNLATYCATKAAVMSLSQCLRADWRRSGVGVSVVCPGFVRDAGMFADSGAELPPAVGSSSTHDVAREVIRAIVRGRQEVVAAPRRHRAISHAALIAPRLWRPALSGKAAVQTAKQIAAGQVSKR